MRKSYSPEIEQQVIEKYLSGESVREISTTLGVSTGYVSNCIENFSSKLEKVTIDAIHDFYKIIRKIGLNPQDAFSGYALFSIISKYKLDVNQINSFIESVLLFSKQNELSAEQLVNFCKKLSIVQSISDVSLEELDDYYSNFVTQKKQLEEEVSKLDLQYKQSKNNLSSMLEKKSLTEKQVEKTNRALEFLKTIGLDISDLNSISNMLQNAKTKNYDLSEIIHYLNQDKSLEFTLQEKQSRLEEVEVKTRKSIKKHEELSLMRENLTLRHDSMLKSIKSVKYLSENGVPVETIHVWQQIFDSFELKPDEFIQELQDIGDMKKLNCNLEEKRSKLTKDITRLEKKKSWLENNNDSLISEISNGTEFGKNNLKKITDHTESQINQTIIHAKKSLNDFMKQNQNEINFSQKQFTDYFLELSLKLEELLEHSHKAEYSLGKMESLQSLDDLINGKFDPVTSIPQIIIILDKLFVNIKDSNFNSSIICSEIKRLREKLLDLIIHE